MYRVNILQSYSIRSTVICFFRQRLTTDPIITTTIVAVIITPGIERSNHVPSKRFENISRSFPMMLSTRYELDIWNKPENKMM